MVFFDATIFFFKRPAFPRPLSPRGAHTTPRAPHRTTVLSPVHTEAKSVACISSANRWGSSHPLPQPGSPFFFLPFKKKHN